jgi:hypothetical protein
MITKFDIWTVTITLLKRFTFFFVQQRLALKSAILVHSFYLRTTELVDRHPSYILSPYLQQSAKSPPTSALPSHNHLLADSL